MTGQKTNRKLSVPMAVVLSCFVGVGLGVIALNYWHATKCSGVSTSNDQMESYVQAIEKRLLQAESEVSYSLMILSYI